jgi:hypothetical protein
MISISNNSEFFAKMYRKLGKLNYSIVTMISIKLWPEKYREFGENIKHTKSLNTIHK